MEPCQQNKYYQWIFWWKMIKIDFFPKFCALDVKFKIFNVQVANNKRNNWCRLRLPSWKLYAREISTFFGSSTPSAEIHYFFDHINSEMIENLFHEGHEKKTFFAWKSLYEPLSGPELRSWIRFLMIEIFHIFSIFTNPENGPNMQKSRKIMSKILKKVDPKTRIMSPKPLPSAFSPLFRFNCASECKSLSFFHPIAHAFSASKTHLGWLRNQFLGFGEAFARVRAVLEEVACWGHLKHYVATRWDLSPRIAGDSIFSKVVRTRIFLNPLTLDPVGVK